MLEHSAHSMIWSQSQDSFFFRWSWSRSHYKFARLRIRRAARAYCLIAGAHTPHFCLAGFDFDFIQFSASGFRLGFALFLLLVLGFIQAPVSEKWFYDLNLQN